MSSLLSPHCPHPPKPRVGCHWTQSNGPTWTCRFQHLCHHGSSDTHPWNTCKSHWDNAGFTVALLSWRPGWLRKCWAPVPTNGCLQRSLCCDTRHRTHVVSVWTFLYLDVLLRSHVTEGAEMWGPRDNAAAFTSHLIEWWGFKSDFFH